MDAVFSLFQYFSLTSHLMDQMRSGLHFNILMGLWLLNRLAHYFSEEVLIDFKWLDSGQLYYINYFYSIEHILVTYCKSHQYVKVTLPIKLYHRQTLQKVLLLFLSKLNSEAGCILKAFLSGQNWNFLMYTVKAAENASALQQGIEEIKVICILYVVLLQYFSRNPVAETGWNKVDNKILKSFLEWH